MEIIEKMNRFRALQDEILKLKEDIYKYRGETIKDENDAIRYIKAVAPLDKEVAYCIFLDAKNNILDLKCISEGSLSFTIISPREIIKHAIAVGALSVIVIHNHPSGDPSPSEDDKKITKKLLFALKPVDIELLDHIIIGNNNNYSFCAEGIIAEYEKNYILTHQF